MKRKLMGILITAMLFACSIVGSIVVFGQEETPELKFLDAYMGGQSFSSDAAIPPVTTNYGTGIGLTFAANVYNLSANTASNGYAQELHDVDTNIADGDSGAVLKNKDLVIYDAAEGQDRTVSAIWYDLNGGIVFRFNEDQLAEDDSLVDPISGLQYIAYGDGDRVTVKKGFTFAYNDGSEEKELVLQNDVTVEYSAEEADWNEVIPEGGQSSFGGVYAEDVSITTGGGNYSMWGFTIDFFTDATRPAAFAGVVSGNTAAGSLKTVARITTGEAERAFFWDKNLVKYIEADGDVQDINMMYLNDKAQVCVRRADQSGVASASEGDKILLRKGFRVGYYYGQISDTVNNLGWTHYAAVQPVGVLMEDVLMVYRDGNWVHAQLAESAEFTTDISEIYKGQSVRLELSLSEGADELPVFSSSNPAAVSVDEDGVITGGDVSGTATITAIFSNTEATIEIANKTDVEVNGIEVSTIADYGKVILYQGKTPDKEDIVNQLQAYYLYANGFPGEAIALQADHIDLTGYDQGTIGDQTITVRVDGYSAAVPAEVFALPETVAPDYAKINNWGGALSINFAHLTADINAGVQQIDNAVLERLGVFDTVVLKNAEKEGGKAVSFDGMVYIYKQQVVFNVQVADLKVGTTLELKEGFRIYYVNQGAYIAAFELGQDYKAVFDGQNWHEFVAEASEIELETDELTLPVGAYYKLPYKVLPENSYITANIISSDENVVRIENGYIEVLKASSEPVELTIRLGTDESTDKSLTIHVVDEEVSGVEIFNERVYSISKGGSLDLSVMQGMPVYTSGNTGTPFALTAENTKIGEFDANQEGEKEVTLTITVDGQELETTITVSVEPYYEQIPGGVMTTPWGGAAQLVVDFAKTYNNAVNIPEDLPGLIAAKDFIRVMRGETEIPFEVNMNGTYLVITPSFTVGSNNWEVGDEVIVSPGLVFYRWTGADVDYSPVGEGDYVAAGEVKYEIRFVCTDMSVGSWDTLIEYEGVTVLQDPIEVQLGKLKDPGAILVPDYATVGEIEVKSNDTSIVEVNASGLLHGVKIGTTTVIITVTGGEEPVSIEVTVNVVDVISGIQFSQDSVNLDPGTSLNGQVLADKGITAKFIWASGKVEGDVDLSKATFIGYDPDATGEQEVTVRLVQDGVSVTGTIIVNVGGGGCNSSVLSNGYIFGAIGVSLLCVALIFVRRKSE